MVFSGAERTRKSRFNKAIGDFSNEYLMGETKAPIRAYIEAKEKEFCSKHGVDGVQFNQNLITAFIKEVEMLSESHGAEDYSVEDMFCIWRELEK